MSTPRTEWHLEYTAMMVFQASIVPEKFEQCADLAFTIESLDILLAQENVTSIRLRKVGASEEMVTGKLATVDDDGEVRWDNV